MDIADWRKQIDEIDRKLVELLNQRAQAAHEIGKLKRDADMPIYEPDRERAVFDECARSESGAAARSRSVADLRTHHGRHAPDSAGRDRAEAAATDAAAAIRKWIQT